MLHLILYWFISFYLIFSFSFATNYHYVYNAFPYFLIFFFLISSLFNLIPLLVKFIHVLIKYEGVVYFLMYVIFVGLNFFFLFFLSFFN